MKVISDQSRLLLIAADEYKARAVLDVWNMHLPFYGYYRYMQKDENLIGRDEFAYLINVFNNIQEAYPNVEPS